MKDEIAALQLESDKATQQKRTIVAQIDDLQRSIARFGFGQPPCTFAPVYLGHGGWFRQSVSSVSVITRWGISPKKLALTDV